MGLVNTDWLAGHLADPNVRICDVRWYLPTAGKRGADEYVAGHIPGAVFIDLDRDLASPDDGRAGRHPLPDAKVFESAMRRAGVSAATHVVAYDDAGGAMASRLWWLLRAHGHSNVSLLDGGITRWKAENRELSRDAGSAQPGSFESHWDPGVAIDLDGVRERIRLGAVVFDARSPDRYRGDNEPVDARPGHIPGVINVPFAGNLSSGVFLAPAQLRERFAPIVQSRPVIASCGSGVTACHDLFALDLSGIRPFEQTRLYVGSYSEWARHRELPVAVGDPPGVPS